MTIETILVCGSMKPKPQDDVVLVHITNPADGKPVMELMGREGGYDSICVIRAGHGGDIAAVLHDRLSSIEFESNEGVIVAIYSDCAAVSAYDAAFIAHLDMPNVPVETQSGGRVLGFKTVVRPIVEDEFEAGGMAALDGIPIEANPNMLGSVAYDRWMCGHQSNQTGAVNAEAH